MEQLAARITIAFESGESVPRDQVVAWCREAKGIDALAALYRVTRDSYEEIEPPLGMKETCRVIRRYLLESIRLDPQGEDYLGRHDAAHELESWFDHLASITEEDTSEMLRESASAVTELYLESDSDVRNAIDTGFLEHLLEQESLRPWFAHWADDERLSESWQSALAWGKAHRNFMRGLRQTLEAADGGE